MGIDKRKKYVLVIDIETANITKNAIAYDIGFAVADKKGRVYVSVPPLYCWGLSEKDFGWCSKIEDVPSGVKNMHRFKGLGEMNNL